MHSCSSVDRSTPCQRVERGPIRLVSVLADQRLQPRLVAAGERPYLDRARKLGRRVVRHRLVGADALVKTERRDVDQRPDVGRLGARVGHHRANAGVTDQHDRVVDLAEDAGHVLAVEGQPAQRVGDRLGRDPSIPQPLEHACPTRSIGERAVDENHGGVLARRGHRSFLASGRWAVRTVCVVPPALS